jgi:dipeptide/tripeptide permease
MCCTPRHLQAINPILILAFIPLFQGVVYPAVRKCGINPTYAHLTHIYYVSISMQASATNVLWSICHNVLVCHVRIPATVRECTFVFNILFPL